VFRVEQKTTQGWSEAKKEQGRKNGASNPRKGVVLFCASRAFHMEHRALWACVADRRVA